MLIRDLEHKTGLDRATIRFYEREGIISPERQENGYRTYSAADEQTLLKVKLLRQLGFSLDKIKQLQQGSGELDVALGEQIRCLDTQMHVLNRAKMVCEEIRGANVTYASLDAKFYLLRLSQPAQSAAKGDFREPVRREYHPWRRFLARMLDYQMVRCLLTFLLVVVMRVRPFGDFLSSLITYGTPFLVIPLEAVMLHYWGATPGKWLFGLRVESENGGTLSLSAARERAWHVLHQGLGFGIPAWEFWRLYKSYQAYRDDEMEWDWETEYLYEPWHWKRKAALACAAAMIAAVSVWNASEVTKPKYRGELTIAEFAENYNFYYAIADDQVTRSERMQSDGTWYPESDNSFTIYIDGQPLVPKQTFAYETKDGIITKIRYENSWTDIFHLNPVSTQCKVAAITLLMSQKGNGLRDLYAFAEQMETVNFTESGKMQYSNIELCWTVTAQNCTAIDNETLIRTDDSLNTSAAILFEILIY